MTDLRDINFTNTELLQLNPELELLKATPRAKYRNVEAIYAGALFKSGREAKRAGELALRYRAGEIINLDVQVPFRLPGKTLYYGDFVYIEVGNPLVIVVEDVKVDATRTEAYRIKYRQMEEIYGVKIAEV